MKNNSEVDIENLYPNLDNDELKEAEKNLDRYLEIVIRIFDRLESEPDNEATQP